MKTEFREQSAKLRKTIELKNKEGVSIGLKLAKVDTAGVMASRGRWSAWGADQALASDALSRMVPFGH